MQQNIGKDKEYTFKEDAEEFINDFKLVILEDIENYILKELKNIRKGS